MFYFITLLYLLRRISRRTKTLAKSAETVDKAEKVWYSNQVKQSKVKAFTCKVSSVTGQ